MRERARETKNEGDGVKKKRSEIRGEKETEKKEGGREMKKSKVERK